MVLIIFFLNLIYMYLYKGLLIPKIQKMIYFHYLFFKCNNWHIWFACTCRHCFKNESSPFISRGYMFIIGCNGTRNKAWFLNVWFSITSIIMNIAHWRGDDIHHMTISNLKEMEMQQGLLWTTYLQKERLSI
jgi:hypothetical protein